MQHEILPPEKRMTGLGECRVEPQDNSIVLFPSRCVHEVTLLERDPTDFGAGHVRGRVLLGHAQTPRSARLIEGMQNV